MRTVVVPHGDAPPRPLPLHDLAEEQSDGATPQPLAPHLVEVATDERGLLDLRVETQLSGESLTLLEVLRRSHTDAFLVADRQGLVCEYYSTPAQATTTHPLHSITKSFVGALCGIAMADGLLDPQATASWYLPELAYSGYAHARIRDLLDMRTGGDYVETHHQGEIADLAGIFGWDVAPATLATDSLHAYLSGAVRVAQVGGVFSYRSLDTEVLGWVLERVTGRSLADLIGRQLLAPIGAEADGDLLVDAYGAPHASGGLRLRPRDVVRYGSMLLNSGSVGERQVLAPMFLKDTRHGEADSTAAFRARVGERVDAQVSVEDVNGLYRNQFWVPQAGGRQLLCLGVHGQALLVDGDNGVVALKLSQWPTPQDPASFTDGLTALGVVAEHVGGSWGDGPELLG